MAKHQKGPGAVAAEALLENVHAAELNRQENSHFSRSSQLHPAKILIGWIVGPRLQVETIWKEASHG